MGTIHLPAKTSVRSSYIGHHNSRYRLGNTNQSVDCKKYQMPPVTHICLFGVLGWISPVGHTRNDHVLAGYDRSFYSSVVIGLTDATLWRTKSTSSDLNEGSPSGTHGGQTHAHIRRT